ncbi:hypothetical protein AR457_13735 [Streptomyces agglomeratus]|uniref:Uncharacterized protein n=1 Tax=Streptomyces agglomeratus TaxID=285458 RepID=A0A1E5P747_9ACTN|nr:hypothetical protein AS594_13565 [Streptomyces agglomeratus]OEJ40601.1 hypothetical protein BGK70_22915 [Streptomyces agglomeratus]OEJ45018.1 hypothetical protein AR457_13735 [Streptomyces agglomeratus]OEJ53148.1 hypothetical protein BGK72_22535 [Streptomyces agglomeratus]OEJ60485.1 hypothetical protein BGM19_23245 [Streptomyces agglomeratus]
MTHGPGSRALGRSTTTALIFGGTHLAAAFRRRRRLSAGATSAAGVLFLGFAAKLSLSGV